MCYNIKGKSLQYVDSKWMEVSGQDRYKLNKLEGQVCQDEDLGSLLFSKKI